MPKKLTKLEIDRVSEPKPFDCLLFELLNKGQLLFETRSKLRFGFLLEDIVIRILGRLLKGF